MSFPLAVSSTTETQHPPLHMLSADSVIVGGDLNMNVLLHMYIGRAPPGRSVRLRRGPNLGLDPSPILHCDNRVHSIPLSTLRRNRVPHLTHSHNNRDASRLQEGSYG